MKDKYRIGEVEKILGIPRSTIQFYIKKGVLKVKKDKNNGYRYYSHKDIREIKYLIVGRSYLNLSLDDSHQRIYTSSLENFHKMFYHQEEVLTKRILKDRRSLEIIVIFNRMLSRIEKYLDKFIVIEAGPFHFFSEFYVFNANTTVIDVGYTVSVFYSDNGHPAYSKLCSIVHDQDRYLIADEDFAAREGSTERMRYLYTVLKSDKDMVLPELLEPSLACAKKQGLHLETPYYLSYLFEVMEEQKNNIIMKYICP